MDVVGDIRQPTHLLFILVVALLVLGPKRLPEVGRALGRGLRDFRSAMSGEDRSEPTISASSDPAPTATAIHEPTDTTSFGTEPPMVAENGSSPSSETERETMASEPVTTVTGSEPSS